MKLREAGHLLACDRVSDEDDASERELIKDSRNVCNKCVEVTRWQLRRRCTESTARDTKDVKSGRESPSEIIEDMRGVPPTSEKDDRRAGATPVDNLETDVGIDLNESASGRAGIPRLRNERCRSRQRTN
jgi:hypothetical protein